MTHGARMAETQATATGQTKPLVFERFSPGQSGAALGLGVFSLVVGGLYAILLGALAREGRLSGAEIGLTATLETLSLGITAGLASAALKPERLRTIGIGALMALTAAQAGSATLSHGGQIAARAAAGVPEGLLLWIAIGLVARNARPERYAGVMALGQPVSQILFAVPIGALAIPRFGATGAFATLAAAALLMIPVALFLPRRYGPTPMVEDGGRGFGRVGWIALAGTTASVAAFTSVAVYLAPLATFAGHGPGVVALAVTLSLAAQIAGASLATVLAGRVSPIRVLVGVGVSALVGWGLLATAPPAWLFVAAATGLGFVAFLGSPFLVAFIVEVDVSRRAALQSGAAQVLGGAFGPLVASRLAGGADPRPALAEAAVLITMGTLAFVLIARPRPAQSAIGSGA